MTPHTPRLSILRTVGLPTPFVTASLLLALFGGCARPVAPSPSAPASTSAQAPAPTDPAAPAWERPCGEGGRPNDHTRGDDCAYQQASCCYDSLASACEAAACSEAECTVLESYPPQVTCAEPVARPPEGCLVRHEGVCYPTHEAACEAAACPMDRCALNKSLPGSITCMAR